MKVLIIDDNENITEAVKDYFELEDIECKTIGDGFEGLQEIQKENYALILLDIAIPKFSGIDILNELKRQNITDKNIIILTASVLQNSEAEEFLKNGIKEILYKPISLDKLDNIIKNYLKR